MKNLNHIKDIKSLIALAIKDNKEVIKDIENGAELKRTMDTWHSASGGVCWLCIAGAVMRGSIGVKDSDEYHACPETSYFYNNDNAPNIISKRDSTLLQIINYIRCMRPSGMIDIPDDFDMLNYDDFIYAYENNRVLRDNIYDGQIKAWEVMYSKIKSEAKNKVLRNGYKPVLTKKQFNNAVKKFNLNEKEFKRECIVISKVGR